MKPVVTPPTMLRSSSSSVGVVVVVDGEVTNRKITVPDDLVWARDHLASGHAEVSS